MLAATILAGGNREDAILGAIESVELFVDHFVLVDSGASAQKAIKIAQAKLGSRCSVFKLPGEFDCATARTFGLECAEKCGADWALILDTDERIHAEPGIVRRMLSEVDADVVLIDDVSRSYKKTKFFRIPHRGYWAGTVHEAYVAQGAQAAAKGITFSELPKSQAENEARNLWIEFKARESIAADPGNSRWHYYLGDALTAQGRAEEAISEFLKAASLSGWDEEVDWSQYRAAVASFDLQNYERALQICLDSGMRIPELAWHASVSAALLGRPQESITLANKAIQLGERQRGQERLGFSCRFAWYEGPHEVLRLVYKAIGDSDKEAECLRMVEELQAERCAVAA